MTSDHSMTREEFRHLLKRLGFAGDRRENDLGYSAFAAFIGKSPRTVIEWGRITGPDSTAATLLRLMAAAKLDREKAADLLLRLAPFGAKPARKG